jgi:signal transduction histidine kinase
MEQMLLANHKQNIQYIADRFPNDVELYSQHRGTKAGLQAAIDGLSTPRVLIWVKRSDGKLQAASAQLGLASATTQRLMSFQDMPNHPVVYPVNDHYLVVCQQPLAVLGEMLGNAYFAQDVTQEQQMLMAGVQHLIGISLLTTAATVGAIALYIRRSLRPLRRISQIAAAISADDLGDARLQLEDAPTELRELAQTFDMMLLRLSQAWEQQRQFVSNVSHELRTPLSIVQGYLQSLLRRSTNLSGTQREALETATAETSRTVRLLEDLLALARADSGYMHYHLQPVVLQDLLAEVMGMATQFETRSITLEAPPEPVQVTTDRDRLTQVLINLIDNAIKYSDPGQPVVLKLEQTEHQALIHVRDRGCGIPLHQQTRIFERFYRIDTARSRSIEGTGLGLSIVKTLVEGMGGSISIRSKPGEGSTFTVSLPL